MTAMINNRLITQFGVNGSTQMFNTLVKIDKTRIPIEAQYNEQIKIKQRPIHFPNTTTQLTKQKHTTHSTERKPAPQDGAPELQEPQPGPLQGQGQIPSLQQHLSGFQEAPPSTSLLQGVHPDHRSRRFSHNDYAS